MPSTVGERLARVEEQLKGIERQIIDMRKDMQSEYVKDQEFRPVKQIVYSMVGIILTGILVGLMKNLGFLSAVAAK
jgi:thiosulfate reductase cytochrome b subunit